MSARMVHGATTPREQRSQVVLFWTLVLALPVAVLFNIEFWLQSYYTGGVFHPSGFQDLYGSGIYRYRLLGRILLLGTYRALLHVVASTPFPMPRDPEANLAFVLAYAVLNGLCFFGTNLITLSVLWRRKIGLRPESLAFYFFVFLLMSVSMAAVTPYDQLAYLLLLLAVAGIRTPVRALGYLCVVVSAAAGMLNRETEFLATSLLVTLAIFAPRSQSRRLWTMAAVQFTVCLAVYVALRILIPGQTSVAGVLTFGGKWGLPAGLVLAGLFAASLALARSIYPSLRPALVFTILSTPYLLLILLTGALRELRLLVPVVLCLLCLYELLAQQGQPDSEAGPILHDLAKRIGLAQHRAS